MNGQLCEPSSALDAEKIIRAYSRPDATVKEQLQTLELAEWVHGLAPWEVFSTLTFRWEASQDSARRCYEKYMRKNLPWVSYFYSIEANPSRDGNHVHALWADTQNASRRDAWGKWFKANGRARIEPVRGKGDVAGYCAKYCTKHGVWWNVKLQWHRIQALNSSPYNLQG